MTSHRTSATVMPGLDAAVGHAFCEEMFEWAEDGDSAFASSASRGAPRPDGFGDAVYSNVRDADCGYLGAAGEVEVTLHGLIEKAAAGSRCVLIKGLSGSGKTTLIRYYLAKYRPSVCTNEHQLVLWIDLKNATEHFDKATLYDRLFARIRASHGTAFALKRELWTRRIKETVPDELLLLWRREGEQVEERELLSRISRWAEDKVLVVEEFIAWWKSKHLGRVFLVVDNIDTMEQQHQTSALQLAMEANDRSVTPMASQIDCMIVSARSATLMAYVIGQQIEVKAEVLLLPALVIATGVGMRLAYLQSVICTGRRWIQVYLSVDLPKLVDMEYTNAAAQWIGRPPEQYPSRFEMLELWSNDSAVAVVGKLAETVESALNPEAASPVGGFGGDKAWEIYRCFCGRSMRRAIQLSRAVLRSPGLMTEALNESQFKAYVFLDALVSTSFEQQPNYIANLFVLQDELFYGAEGVLLLSVLCNILWSEISGPPKLTALASRFSNDFGQIPVAGGELEEVLVSLGFDRVVVSAGILRARQQRLLEVIPGEGGATCGYVIKANLVSGHTKLMHEAAYADNVAQSMPKLWPEFGRVRRTVGYNTRHLELRARNTHNFIEWLIVKELALLSESRVRKQISEWRKWDVPFVSGRIAWHYLDRLRGIANSRRLSPSAERSIKSVGDGIEDVLVRHNIGVGEQLAHLKAADVMDAGLV